MIKSLFFWKCKVLLQSLITALLSFQVLARSSLQAFHFIRFIWERLPKFKRNKALAKSEV